MGLSATASCLPFSVVGGEVNLCQVFCQPVVSHGTLLLHMHVHRDVQSHDRLVGFCDLILCPHYIK